MRKFRLSRETSETKITIEINIDEYSKPEIDTDIKFFNHMLEELAFNAGFTINLKANSFDKDTHHIIEDIATAFGKAFNEALGSKININRYGFNILPMDEALILTSIDICEKPFCSFDVNFKNECINDMPSDLIKHFFETFSHNGLCTIHIKQLNGTYDHHIAEAIFKSFALALREACKLSSNINKPPYTKGIV